MSETIKPTVIFKRPETIDGIVEFPLPTGTTAKLACKFKYRTKKEFGALWDEITQSADADKAASTDDNGAEKEQVSFVALIDQGNHKNASNVLRFLEAWPAELPELNEANLMQAFDEAPASSLAFWNTYRNLCLTGTAGN